MRGFRVAREAPTWRHLAATFAQTAAFWAFFLFVLPEGVVRLERCAAVPPLGLPWRHATGAALFALAGTLGVTSSLFMATLGHGTPLPLAAARRMVVAGPYRVLRNPMALAGIAQGVAVGIWRDSLSVVLYALTGALLWHHVARPPEERDLAARFGQDFLDYRDAVPLWLPRLGTPTRERAFAATALAGVVAAAMAAPWQVAVAAGAGLVLVGGYLWSRSGRLPVGCAATNATSSGHSASKSASNAP